MATYTPNLNLKKPSTGEKYDVVADLNDSKDKIDNEVGSLRQKSAENKEEISNKTLPYFAVKRKLKRDKFNHLSVNYIGDSITAGYDSTDHKKDSWATIMRKFMNIEFNSENLGFIGMHPNEHFHVINKLSGVWSDGNDNAFLGLYKFYSVDPIGYLRIQPKFSCKFIKIGYSQRPDGGIFDVYVNNALKLTVNSAGANDKLKATELIDISSISPLDALTIEIRKKDASIVEISGVWYLNDVNKVMNNNYARDGAKLAEIDTTALTTMLDGNIVFFALGHNDGDLTGFTSKITHAIDVLNSNKAFLVVLDFRWSTDNDDAIRQQLKRLSDEVENSIYIAPTDYMFGTDVASMLDYGFFLDDYSHPGDLGQKTIAETTAKILGLSVSAKDLAEKIHDKIAWHYIGDDYEPLFQNGWVNPFTDNKNRAKYKKVNDIVYVEFYINAGTPNSIAFTLPIGYRPRFEINHILYMTKEGAELLFPNVNINAEGEVKMGINNASVTWLYYYGAICFSAI